MIPPSYRFFAPITWADEEAHRGCWRNDYRSSADVGDGTCYTGHYLHGFDYSGNGWGSGGSIFGVGWNDKTKIARGDAFLLREKSPSH